MREDSEAESKSEDQELRLTPKERHRRWKTVQSGLGLLNVLGMIAAIVLPFGLLVINQNLEGAPDNRLSVLRGRDRLVALALLIIITELLAILGYWKCLAAPVRRGKPLAIAAVALAGVCCFFGGLIVANPMLAWAWMAGKSTKMIVFMFYLRSIALGEKFEIPMRRIALAFGYLVMTWIAIFGLFGRAELALVLGQNIVGATFLLLIVAFFLMGSAYLAALRDFSISIDWLEGDRV